MLQNSAAQVLGLIGMAPLLLVYTAPLGLLVAAFGSLLLVGDVVKRYEEIMYHEPAITMQ